MYYVGLDVHARRSSLCILDCGGRQVKQLQVVGGWGVPWTIVRPSAQAAKRSGHSRTAGAVVA